MSKTTLLEKQYTQKATIKQMGKYKIIVLPSWFPVDREATVTVSAKEGKRARKIVEEDYSGITKNMGVSELEEFLEGVYA